MQDAEAGARGARICVLESELADRREEWDMLEDVKGRQADLQTEMDGMNVPSGRSGQGRTSARGGARVVAGGDTSNSPARKRRRAKSSTRSSGFVSYA